MNPSKHLILGMCAAAILFIIYPEIRVSNILIFATSSVLIDVDHYVYYLFKKKDFNFFRAQQWYLKLQNKCCSLTPEQRPKTYFGIFFLHGLESIIIFGLLGFFISEIFYFISLGFAFHFISDFLVEMIPHKDFTQVSVVYSIIQSKKLIFIENFNV